MMMPVMIWRRATPCRWRVRSNHVMSGACVLRATARVRIKNNPWLTTSQMICVMIMIGREWPRLVKAMSARSDGSVKELRAYSTPPRMMLRLSHLMMRLFSGLCSGDGWAWMRAIAQPINSVPTASSITTQTTDGNCFSVWAISSVLSPSSNVAIVPAVTMLIHTVAANNTISRRDTLFASSKSTRITPNTSNPASPRPNANSSVYYSLTEPLLSMRRIAIFICN